MTFKTSVTALSYTVFNSCESYEATVSFLKDFPSMIIEKSTITEGILSCARYNIQIEELCQVKVFNSI